MPALTFDFEKELDQNYSKTCICHQPDNQVILVGIEQEFQRNETVKPALGYYANLPWAYTPAVITSQKILNLSVISYPQIGGIGFYTLKHENRSVILAPLITDEDRYIAPTMTIDITSEITFNISDPDTVSYDCYRIVIREGYFATEYVTYEQMFTVPKPPTGTYTFSVEGYLNERLASEKYELYDVSVVNPNPVPTPLGDTVYSVNNQVADINGNVTIEAQHVPFSAEGFLTEDVLEAIIEASARATASIHTLATIDWSSNQQTITVDGITATNIVLVAPIPAHQSGYTAANVVCVSQGIDSLTFQCATIPLINIDVQVVIL